jgi:hypothetical protein
LELTETRISDETVRGNEDVTQLIMKDFGGRSQQVISTYFHAN